MRCKLAMAMIGTSCLFLFGSCAPAQQKPAEEKPDIIEVFACSDYCPGPEEKYLKKVYEGVADEDQCIALGGKPYTYVGWGTFFVCIAD